jgi:Fe2+ or Zn2+ uptake regulation protein
MNNALRVLSPGEIDRAEELLSQQLKRIGMKRTKQRSTVLRVFLQTTEPISAHELLCLVKKDDVFIAFTTVYRTLKTIVACGLAKEVIPAGASARYVHEHCSHRHHLVCKDCGAVVDVEEQDGAYLQEQKATKHA